MMGLSRHLCTKLGLSQPTTVSTIGLDLAKKGFPVPGAEAAGTVQIHGSSGPAVLCRANGPHT
jgi:hypothetical protein